MKCYLGDAAVLLYLAEWPFTRHSKERSREGEWIKNIFKKISIYVRSGYRVDSYSFSFIDKILQICNILIN